MILTNRQIVWTPALTRGGMSVALNRTFAEACKEHKLEDAPSFKDGVWRLMGKKLPVPSGFLDLYEASILPKGIYAGRDGLWLTASDVLFTNSKRPLTYYGHNDEMVSDQYWLLRAFAAWADGAMTVLNWE